MCIPLPADAAHLHGGPPGVTVPDLRDPGADAVDPVHVAVGHLPAEPRRTDPGRWSATRTATTCGTSYARDPRMKANIGIRRRLAPLLENDRNSQELFTAMLLSSARLPVPVLRRRDRHGRQHLARRPRRGPDPDAVVPGPECRLLPCPTRPGCTCRRSWTPIYGFQTVNVEAQVNSTASLLHWTRRMIEIRKQHPAFALGEFSDLGGSKPDRAVLHADLRPRRRRAGRDGPLRQQSLPIPPAGRTRPPGAQRRGAGRTDRRHPVPGHRRAALPADPWPGTASTGSTSPGGTRTRTASPNTTDREVS